MKISTSRLSPGEAFVLRPPKGFHYEWVVPTHVRESDITDTLQCSASPRHLPNEVPTGTGYCVKPPEEMPMIYPTKEACDFIDAEVAWLSEPSHQVEHVAALFLDTHGQVCGVYRHTDQHQGSCTFDIPAIIQEARRVSGAGVWAAHNHTRADGWDEQRGRHWAGAIEPSQADKETTNDFIAALREARLVFIDHTVCGPNAIPFSFRESDKPILHY
jgi:hypothetical protein